MLIFYFTTNTLQQLSACISFHFKQRTHSHTMAHHLDANRCLLHNLIFFLEKNIDESKLLTLLGYIKTFLRSKR